MSGPAIALATARDAWSQDEDAPLLVAALEARGAVVAPAVWDDPAVDWAAHDLVVVRSTWDYTARLDEFLDWAATVESLTRLANPATVLRWNTDKRYLADLAEDGVSVVTTAFLSPTEPDAVERADDLWSLLGLDPDGDVDLVVKPTVSAGSKDTARHRPTERRAATDQARTLLRRGRHVMVQPYLDGVEDAGETGMVFLRGELSHGFRKGPLLLHGAADVDGLFALEDIGPRRPREDEVALGRAVVRAAQARTGCALLYARVDVLPGPDGAPVLLEAELTEPSLFLAQSEGAADRAAAAILAELDS